MRVAAQLVRRKGDHEKLAGWRRRGRRRRLGALTCRNNLALILGDPGRLGKAEAQHRAVLEASISDLSTRAPRPAATTSPPSCATQPLIRAGVSAGEHHLRHETPAFGSPCQDRAGCLSRRGFNECPVHAQAT